ncbi:MAG: GDSL-type esterase/lipase family protein [Pirellulaceae bacterium]
MTLSEKEDAHDASRIVRLLLVVPGITIVVLAIVADLLSWNARIEWRFGRIQLLLAGVGIAIFATGVAVSRIFSPRLVARIAKLVLGAALAFFALCTIETVFRLFDPLGLEYYPEISRYFGQMESDDDFAYIHPPELEGVFQGAHVRINREGLRWREQPITKPEGRHRILVLGDSVVFGWGVEQEQILAAQLERIVHEDNDQWEVVSAGVGSWNTRTEFEWLKKKGVAYQPEIALLVVVPNDIFSKNLNQNNANGGVKKHSIAKTLWTAIATRSYVIGFYQHQRNGRLRLAAEDAAYSVVSWQWQDVDRALQQMAEICTANDIIFLAALPFSKDRNQPFYARYEDSFSRYRIPYTVLPDVTMHRNSVVDGHPNAEGHRILAVHLRDFLKANLSAINNEP